jgi:hypothetical protein
MFLVSVRVYRASQQIKLNEALLKASQDYLHTIKLICTIISYNIQAIEASIYKYRSVGLPQMAF